MQNQSYGYLFPLGPFFGLGAALDVPGWVVQRAWLALLLCLAFTGTVTLADRLGLGRPGSRLLAGLAYALAPRMVSTLGAISIEVLPMALAPWVLVPLVVGAVRGSPRRAGLLAGLLVGCVGGVNAAATAAVLPLPLVWLLTRPAGPRRTRLAAWWVAGTALATAWWVVPLLLLGRYSPPFLDYIETARTTTSVTELAEVLRGTSQWLAHLATGRGPTWPAGWELVHSALTATAAVVLAAVGAAALVRRHTPHRRFLALGALTGLALVGAGHLDAVQGVFAGPLHDALDGVLAPLRNVHKFDPVLRLPLALAVADLAGRAVLALRLRRARRHGASRRAAPATARAALLLVVLAVAGVATPALQLRLTPATGYDALPGYWREAAEWLGARDTAGRALLVPGSTTGVYVWGDTGDEPLQPLAEGPWDVRSSVPLSAIGHIRVLDVVEEQLASGTGSTGLAPFLARSGVGYLVFRADLDFPGVDAARPGLVRRALADSPGLTRVATFGPQLNADTELPGVVLDAGLVPTTDAVEVWAVDDAAPRAWTQPLAGAATVVGGPDAVAQLTDEGLLGSSAALLAGGARVAGPVLVGDALQRRERSFGAIDEDTSAALSPDDPLRLDGPQRDYGADDLADQTSWVRYSGGVPAASSSASDAGGVGGTVVGDHPFAALDGDPATAWRPARGFGPSAPSWWQVTTPRSFAATTVTLQVADLPPDTVTLSTDAGSVTVPLERTTEPQTFDLPRGGTRVVRITAPAVPGRSGGAPLALSEVTVPGMTVSRTVVLPSTATLPDPAVDAWALATSGPDAAGCTTVGGVVRCSPELVATPEEPVGLDRTLPVVAPATYGWTARATPVAGPALDTLISLTGRDGGTDPVLTASASSAVVPDPRSSADAAVDGDPSTAWRAAGDDPAPTLRVSWGLPRTLDSIRLVTAPGSGAAPTVVGIDDGDGGPVGTARVGRDGTVRFAPVTTDQLTLTFPLTDPLSSYDPYTRSSTAMGVAIAEVEVPGTGAADPAAVVELPCGSGPAVVVGGTTTATSATTTLAGLRALTPVPLTPCDGEARVDLARGEQRVVVGATDVLRGTAATLVRVGAGTVTGTRDPTEVLRWDAEDRAVAVGGRSAETLLVVPESANPGWTARLDGVVLPAVTVDGWQQGWVLPPGAAGVVELGFAPGTVYRTALLAGAGAVVVLLVLLAVPARRATPATRPHRWSTGSPAAVAVAGGAVLVVGGWVGVGVLGLVAGARAVAGRLAGPVAADRVLVGAAAVGVLGSGLALVLALPVAEGWRQSVALLTVAALALAAGGRRGPARTRPRSR